MVPAGLPSLMVLLLYSKLPNHCLSLDLHWTIIVLSAGDKHQRVLYKAVQVQQSTVGNLFSNKPTTKAPNIALTLQSLLYLKKR